MDVLRDLLMHLRDGQFQGRSQLAQALDVTPDLVEQMLDDLTRRGYVTRSESASCEASCGSCSHCGGAQLRGPTVWTLTEKGLRSGQKTAPEG